MDLTVKKLEINNLKEENEFKKILIYQDTNKNVLRIYKNSFTVQGILKGNIWTGYESY